MDAVTARLEALEQHSREMESAVARLDAENRSLRSWRRVAGFFMAATAVALGIALMPATPAVAQTTLEQRVQVLEQKLLYVSRVGRDMVFNAVNVHIRNGGRTTQSANGLGNLIVGFNERRGNGTDNRTGSHNLILGVGNNYSSYGGQVGGYYNAVTAQYAVVSTGYLNTASGMYASVSGGRGNTANGDSSSVSGGSSNTASGYTASVSGGRSNTASGSSSSVSGGYANTASGDYSSVSGGSEKSTLSTFNWRAGGLFQEQ